MSRSLLEGERSDSVGTRTREDSGKSLRGVARTRTEAGTRTPSA